MSAMIGTLPLFFLNSFWKKNARRLFFSNVPGESLFPIQLCVGSHSSGAVILLCVGNEIISALQIFQETLCLKETSEPC